MLVTRNKNDIDRVVTKVIHRCVLIFGVVQSAKDLTYRSTDHTIKRGNI